MRLGGTVYGPGEGAGFLKIVPEGEQLQEWSTRDVVVVRDAPLDLSIVSALLSAGPQSGASHLSLRLKEKNIPNASVPEVYAATELTDWNGQLVHVRMAGALVEIRRTTMAEAEALWARQRPPVGALALDLQRRDWASFATLAHDGAPAYGAKSANVGELHRILPEANRVSGFALPLSLYDDFLRESGLEAEAAALSADRQLPFEPTLKKARLAQLRDAIESAPLPSAMVAQLVETAIATFGSDAPTRRLRFRSSTNAEDLEVFSGAGLYESRSGCLADDLDGDTSGPSACLDPDLARHLGEELTRWSARRAREPQSAWIDEIIEDLESELQDEKSAARALKKVWGSLWNDRAYDEREYYGLDHARVKMGVAVQLSEKQERLEAVAFTNVRYGDSPPFYAMVSQVGEIGVVRPVDPTATSESRLFWRGNDGEIAQEALISPSSLATDGASLWPAERLRELGRLLFVVQDHFETQVYAGRSSSFDVELKITRDDRLIIKQARPYLSNLPPF